MSNSDTPLPFSKCQICGHDVSTPNPKDLGTARGNTERFRNTDFRLWKCPRCLTIFNVDPVDYHDIYSDYPLLKRRLDVYARGTMRNLLRRLKRAGLKKGNTILDYGCGNGIFIEFLKKEGYPNVTGYDPYVPEFADLPTEGIQFDCVICNDAIEHCDNPREMIQRCSELLSKGGLLYIGTADSEPVDMGDLEPQLMRLHQPFHRIILTEESLHRLCTEETGLRLVRAYRRSYMDTWMPFANYRFLDELNRAVDHNLDRTLSPDIGRVFLRKPWLMLYAMFGYFIPSAYEPAVILRKPI